MFSSGYSNYYYYYYKEQRKKEKYFFWIPNISCALCKTVMMEGTVLHVTHPSESCRLVPCFQVPIQPIPSPPPLYPAMIKSDRVFDCMWHQDLVLPRRLHHALRYECRDICGVMVLPSDKFVEVTMILIVVWSSFC